jgi:hypothetical protein
VSTLAAIRMLRHVAGARDVESDRGNSPNRIRGAAVSVAVSALGIACFALTFTFPVLNRALGAAGTFWLYGGICFLGFVFVLAQASETKGKALEQIEN